MSSLHSLFGNEITFLISQPASQRSAVSQPVLLFVRQSSFAYSMPWNEQPKHQWISIVAGMCVEFDAIFIKSEFPWNGHISHDLVLWQAHLLVIQTREEKKQFHRISMSNSNTTKLWMSYVRFKFILDNSGKACDYRRHTENHFNYYSKETLIYLYVYRYNFTPNWKIRAIIFSLKIGRILLCAT